MNGNYIQNFKWGTIEWISHHASDNTAISLTSIVTFLPKAIQDTHYHLNEEQIIYVIEGKGYQLIDGIKTNFKTGMTFHSPSLVEHTLVNTEEKPLKLLITYTKVFVSDSVNPLNLTLYPKDIALINQASLKMIVDDFSHMLSLNITIINTDSDELYAKKYSQLYDISIDNYLMTTGKCKEDIISIITCENDFNVSQKSIYEILIPIESQSEILGYVICNYFVASDNSTSINPIFDPKVKIPHLQYNQIISAISYLENIATFIVADITRKKNASFVINKNEELLEKNKQILELENQINLTKTNGFFKKNNSTTNSRSRINFNTFASPQYLYSAEFKLLKSIAKLDLVKFNENFSNLKSEIVDKYGYIEISLSIIKELFPIVQDDFYCNNLRKTLISTIDNCDIEVLGDKIEFILKNELIKLRSKTYSDNQSLIEHVKKYITLNYSSKITLEDLSLYFHISPNYLSSLFNEETNQSLNEFINEYRVEISKKLLLTSAMTIGDIAVNVGFNSSSYFISNFKKFCNLTPLEFRKNNGI